MHAESRHVLLHGEVSKDLLLILLCVQPFMEAGLDSLGAVELRNNLCTAFNMELPATAIFDYPSAAALAQWLQQQSVSTSVAQRDEWLLMMPLLSAPLPYVLANCMSSHILCVHTGGNRSCPSPAACSQLGLSDRGTQLGPDRKSCAAAAAAPAGGRP